MSVAILKDFHSCGKHVPFPWSTPPLIRSAERTVCEWRNGRQCHRYEFPCRLLTEMAYKQFDPYSWLEWWVPDRELWASPPRRVCTFVYFVFLRSSLLVNFFASCQVFVPLIIIPFSPSFSSIFALNQRTLSLCYASDIFFIPCFSYSYVEYLASNHLLTYSTPSASLNTESEYVRARLAQHMNDLLSLGVRGFRMDATKRIACLFPVLL